MSTFATQCVSAATATGMQRFSELPTTFLHGMALLASLVLVFRGLAFVRPANGIAGFYFGLTVSVFLLERYSPESSRFVCFVP